MYEDNNYLAHYGVKGMKWGVRKVQKYEAKAEKYRSLAENYGSKNHTSNLTNRQKTKLNIKSSKYNAKAETMDVKARLAKEGKSDIKKLREASKLHGHFRDTQGMIRGPYADIVGSIRAQKGERYASELVRKYENQQIVKLTAGATAASIAYTAAMAALINKM